ncbi:hypothetical protein HYU13_00015 [Candidatus Woesearchaeota archaeon]|nr:hypothetical protein [Candidatus Woesearchaeota archaeon]
MKKAPINLTASNALSSVLLMFFLMVSLVVSVFNAPFAAADAFFSVETGEPVAGEISGKMITVPLKIINGPMQQTVGFSTDKPFATVSSPKASFKSNEAKILLLSIDPKSAVAGEQEITLFLVSSLDNKKRAFRLNASLPSCYESSFELIEEPPKDLCGCDDLLISYSLANTGIKAETYLMTLNYPDGFNDSLGEIPGSDASGITLLPGKKKTFSIVGNVDCEFSGKIFISAEAVSNQTGQKLSLENVFGVEPFEECYATVVSLKDQAVSYDGKIVPFSVKNTGKRALSYNLSAEGIDWFELSSATFSLVPRAKKQLTFHLKPAEDTPEGEYPVILTLRGEEFEVTKEISVKLSRRNPFFGQAVLYAHFSRYYVLLAIVVMLLAGIRISSWRKKRNQKKLRMLKRLEKLQEREKEKIQEKGTVEKRTADINAEKTVKKAADNSEMKQAAKAIILTLVIVAAGIFGTEQLKSKRGFEKIGTLYITYQPYSSYGLIGAGALVLFALGYALIRRRKKRKRVFV